jgi:release factor glutamine methyltransferase
MNALQIKAIFSTHLSSIYSQNEADAIFSLICLQLLNYSKIELHTNKEIQLKPDIETRILSILDRLMLHEPIQYILGTTEFYNLTFQIDKRALIPRQETELLVDTIIKDLKGKSKLKIIDLCTGSGCIAIALSSNLKNVEITATDLSKDALDLASYNAKRNNSKIHFINDSVLDLHINYELFDVIVCNPPYVRKSEIPLMAKNVIDFEPHMALFVSNSDPLIFYKAIADFSMKYLTQSGIIYCEINESLGRETSEIFINRGFNQTTILKDLNSKDRFIKAFRR